MAMIHYGQMLDVEKVERIYAALPAGGLEPTAKTAYILVRTCVNAGALDKAEAYAVSLSQTGVRLKGSTLELLGARGAEGRAQPGAGGGAGSGRSSAAVRGVLQELDDDEAAAAAASWDEADGGAGEDVQEGDGELASASVSASTGAGPRQVLFGGGGGRAPPRGVSAGASRVAVEGFLSRCSSTSHSFFHAAGLRSCSLRHQQPRTTRVAAVASSVIIARG